MKKASFLIALFLLLLFACTREKKSSLLSTDNIRTQLFSIDPTKENRIQGARGGRFTIPAGAFEGTATVTIELKEVYAPIEILAAGLRTESNGEVLESGGMFYLKAKRDGKELELKKEIDGSIPADYINDSMKLFKGEVEEDGNVNWVDPVELSNIMDSNAICIETGKHLFRANCFSCHSIFEKVTGPALGNSEKLYTREDYYKLIRNPALFARENAYFSCEIHHYNGLMMTAFPLLSNQDVDCIIKYIDNQVKKRPDLIVQNDSSYLTTDGCEALPYNVSPCGNDTTYINEEFETVIKNTFTKSDYDTLPTNIDTAGYIKDTSSPIQTKEDRYNFKINTLGWYNIDILMKNLPGITEVNLDATTDFPQKTLVEIKLYFPEKKISLSAEYNIENETFTFGGDGNKIPLYIGDLAIAFSIAEWDDKIFYDVQEFRITKSQTIKITLNETTKEELEKAFKKINLDNINLDRLTKKPVVIPIPCNDTTRLPAK